MSGLRATRAVQASQSICFTPLLPFLYDTGTIRSAAGAHRLMQRASKPSCTRSKFSTCTSLRNIPWAGGRQLRNGRTNRETSYRKPTASRSNAERPKRFSREQSGLDGDTLEHDMDFGSSIYEPFPDDFDGPEDPVALTGPRRPSEESTITITEMRAFDQIFDSIRTRHQGRQLLDGTLPATLPPTMNAASLRDSHSILEDIMQESIQIEREKTNKKAPLTVDKTRREGFGVKGRSPEDAQKLVKEAIDKYPAILQKGAATALKAKVVLDNIEMDSQPASDSLEERRKPARERVEKLLRNAKTDVELWTVMEKEVFSMVEKLGLQKDSAKKGWAETQQEKAAPANVKPDLDLDIHGPLYPAFLLLSLRLLDRSFSKPSPLTRSILPRIKSLGIMSQVLGASTSLYNELLRIAWYRNDDMKSVFVLLEEMEGSGLDLDRETLQILEGFAVVQRQSRAGKNARALRSLWSMPEYNNGAVLLRWRDKVRGLVEERSKAVEESLEWDA